MPSGVTTLGYMARQFPDTITVSCNRCDRRGRLGVRRALAGPTRNSRPWRDDVTRDKLGVRAELSGMPNRPPFPGTTHWRSIRGD